MESIAQNPTEINTKNKQFMAMYEANRRIDNGAGKPEDVKIALTNGALFYAGEAQRITGDKKPLVEKDAEKLKRFKNAGPYGLMAYCSDMINFLHTEAMKSGMNNAPETARKFIDRAKNWQEVLNSLREELIKSKEI